MTHELVTRELELVTRELAGRCSLRQASAVARRYFFITLIFLHLHFSTSTTSTTQQTRSIPVALRWRHWHFRPTLKISRNSDSGLVTLEHPWSSFIQRFLVSVHYVTTLSFYSVDIVCHDEVVRVQSVVMRSSRHPNYQKLRLLCVLRQPSVR